MDNFIPPLLLLALAVGVTCRIQVDGLPLMVDDDAVRRDDIFIGGGRPDHADTTLVVVMIGDEVVVKRSNTLMVMLDLLVWPLVLVIFLLCVKK